MKPSVSFCKALDNEEEYDQTDAIASTSLGRFGCVVDAKPDRNMEVGLFFTTAKSPRFSAWRFS